MAAAPVTVSEIAPGIGRIVVSLPLGVPDHLNCYVLLEERVLVDTGMRGSEDALRAGLAHFGLAADDVRVLLTHSHPDHWASAGGIAERALAHPRTRDELALNPNASESLERSLLGRKPSSAVLELMMAWRDFAGPPPLIDEITDGDRIGEWRVIDTRGHAAGHLGVHRASDAILISGDLFVPKGVPHLYLSPISADPLGDHLASLRRVAALGVQIGLPSHGKPISNVAERAAVLIEQHVERLRVLEEELARGPADSSELTTRLFGEARHPMLQILGEMDTNAHLEHLRLNDRLAALGPQRWAKTT